MRYELQWLNGLLVADERGVQIQTTDDIHFIPLDQLTAVDIEPPCLTHPGYIVLETSNVPHSAERSFSAVMIPMPMRSSSAVCISATGSNAPHPAPRRIHNTQNARPCRSRDGQSIIKFLKKRRPTNGIIRTPHCRRLYPCLY